MATTQHVSIYQDAFFFPIAVAGIQVCIAIDGLCQLSEHGGYYATHFIICYA